MSTSVVEKTMSKSHEKLIKFVVSPGTMSGIGQAPDTILPTGEKTLVLSEHTTVQFTMRPDPSGSIIILSMPFFEAPWARVYLKQDGSFDYWEAISLPTYNNGVVPDPLKANNIYAYRFVANGLTGYNTSAVLNASGSVTLASLPLSLDQKIIYDSSSMGMPLSYTRCLDKLPLNSDSIAAVTNDMITHPAIEGSYCVLRHTDPTIPFVYRDSDMSKAMFNLYYRDTNELGNIVDGGGQNVMRTNYLAWSDANQPGAFIKDAAGNPVAVSAPSAMNVCITCYSGLNTNDKITFKGVAAWEFIPKMNSPKVPQCRVMKPRDTVFLEMLNAAELKSPALGKASDNSFGSFLKGVLGFIAKNTPIIKEVVSMLPGPAGAVASKIMDVIPRVNAAVNRAAAVVNRANQVAKGKR